MLLSALTSFNEFNELGPGVKYNGPVVITHYAKRVTITEQKFVGKNDAANDRNSCTMASFRLLYRVLLVAVTAPLWLDEYRNGPASHIHAAVPTNAARVVVYTEADSGLTDCPLTATRV